MKNEVVGANILTRFLDTSAFGLLSSAFPVVPLGEPYWNAATYRAILRCVFSASVIDGTAIGDLRSLLIEVLGVEDALLCNSGSCALEIALRACGVGKNDEVVIPTFCCSAVVPPILAVGALPVLADIGPELNLTVESVDAALTRKTQAIIVPHLFGNPADIGAIVALARAKNVRVIDDAAQALGATVGSRAVGTFGDVGILSFGKEKICFGLGGGAVLSATRNSQAGDLVARLCQPKVSPTLQNLFSTLMWLCWRRWTLPLQKALSHEIPRDPTHRRLHIERKRWQISTRLSHELSCKHCAKISLLVVFVSKSIESCSETSVDWNLLRIARDLPRLPRSSGSHRRDEARTQRSPFSVPWPRRDTRCRAVMCPCITSPVAPCVSGTGYPTRTVFGPT